MCFSHEDELWYLEKQHVVSKHKHVGLDQGLIDSIRKKKLGRETAEAGELRVGEPHGPPWRRSQQAEEPRGLGRWLPDGWILKQPEGTAGTKLRDSQNGTSLLSFQVPDDPEVLKKTEHHNP